MNSFWIRVISVILIITAIFGYNFVLESRDRNEEIQSLKFDLEQEQNKNKNLEKTIAKEKKQQSTSQTKANTSDSKYKDGTYQGQAQGFGGPIRVEVDVEEGKITNIQILSADGEDNAYLDSAMSIIDSMIQKQGYDVDTVSGATFSSTGIKNAAKEAIGKATK